MKELYSHGLRLSPDSREGYTISELSGGLLEVRIYSAFRDVNDSAFRVPAKWLPPEKYGDLYALGELQTDSTNGTIDGAQILYRGKWYSADTIRKIQTQHDNFNWQRYV